MMRVLAVTVVLAAAIAGSARGAARPGVFFFHDCTGPGAPSSSFTATKENLPDSAAHPASAGIAYLLEDGSGVFVVHQFGDTTVGQGQPAHNLPVTCQVDIPLGTFTFTGFFTPRGA